MMSFRFQFHVETQKLLLQWLLFLFLFLFCSISSASITPGSSLLASNPNQTWPSENSTYSFGFLQSDPPTSPPSFIAGIFYSGGVPIWSAFDSSGVPAVVDSGASLQFLSSGTLRLVNGAGTTVWDSNTAGLGVTSAVLDDAGNLVMKNGSGTVWSTFDNPTDSIVPSQNFTFGKILRSGMYSLRILKNGNITLYWNKTVEYWTQGNSTFEGNLTSPTLGLQSIGILSISDPKLSSPAIVAYSSDYAEGNDILRLLKLDSDGNLRIYSSARGSGTKTERWAAVTDQCQVFGYCGNMGICSYNDSNPICGCPSLNFDPVDPKDSRKGCKRKVEIEDCPVSATMLDLENTRFLTYIPESNSQIFFVGISACRLNCLVSSSCDASTSLSDGTGLCFYKTPGFLSGYQSAALSSSSYIKVCGPVDPNPPASLQNASKKKDWGIRPWMVVVVIVATLIGLIALEGGLWCWFCRNSPTFGGGLSAQYALVEYASGAPVQFSYKELQRSTKGFKEKLGAGGFGAVYKGILANRTVVAVKQLEGIEQGEKQFRMEVATISSTHHLNLVRLIGFCSEGRHRHLVYEFMKNGSLDSFLFATEELSGRQLNWEYRFHIALGTARGITYLHEECRDCIVHCDIKPENILLDENYSSKVSDFGLAKLVNPKDHRYRTLTSVRGTRGYLAPEWLANLPITSKSDVYSYGMVLLEIVSGRRNFEVSAETNHKKFSMWAYEEFEKGNVKGILDKRLADQDVDMEQVIRAIQVSFWCIQEQPSQRPMMGKVVQMLEGITEIERPPALKAATEGSLCGTSMKVSSNFSALSTVGASAPAPSSTSSFLAAPVSPLTLGRNAEKESSSILGSSRI